MPKGMSKRIELRRARAHAAMPEVKRLVRKFGRSVVASCLIKLREHEKGIAKLQALKTEVAKLERQL